MSDPVPSHFWDRVLPDAGDAAFGFAGLVLASRSPQRKHLLEQLGVPFRIVVSEHDEGVTDGNPAHTVQQNARGKAEEVLAREPLQPGELVLGVDTVVVSDGEILGKARGRGGGGEVRAPARRPPPRGVQRPLPHARARSRWPTHGVTGVTFRSADRRGARRATSPAASGATAPAPTPSRASAPASSSAWTATTSTSSACPWRSWCGMLATFGVTPFSWLRRRPDASPRAVRTSSPPSQG